MTGIPILSRKLPGLRRQRTEPAPHVRHASRKPDPPVAGNRDQNGNPCTRPATDANAVGPSVNIRRPSDSVMSTRLARTGEFGAAGIVSRIAPSEPAATPVPTGKKAAGYCQVVRLT